ncbi:MAG: hypothetical protein WBL88_12225, partial [Nitrososphaeraceae archaeon]
DRTARHYKIEKPRTVCSISFLRYTGCTQMLVSPVFHICYDKPSLFRERSTKNHVVKKQCITIVREGRGAFHTESGSASSMISSSSSYICVTIRA